MKYLYSLTAVLFVLSFCKSREKTHMALRMMVKKLTSFLPAFLTMLIMISIVLYVVPDRVISEYLGSGNKVTGVLLASLFGSVTMMPGFIAFPLCGILLKKGVPYMVISALSTTLMMVGVLTYPIEKEYFGMRVTVIRNVMSFIIALIVAFITGIFYGEVL